MRMELSKKQEAMERKRRSGWVVVEGGGGSGTSVGGGGGVGLTVEMIGKGRQHTQRKNEKRWREEGDGGWVALEEGAG